MRTLKAGLFGALLSVIGAFGAVAAPLTGSFSIDIYNGQGGGQSTSPGVQAVNTNPLIAPGTFLGTVGYTGAINFNLLTGNSTIGAFFATGSGTFTGLTAAIANRTLSTASFGVTTVLRITGNTAAISGTIRHDDGIGLYQGGTLRTPFSATAPTSPIDTAYSLNAGAFELIHVSTNGLPQVLIFDVTAVPEPATLALLGSGLLGLGLVRRRRARA